jgi:hypothetical protein
MEKSCQGFRNVLVIAATFVLVLMDGSTLWGEGDELPSEYRVYLPLVTHNYDASWQWREPEPVTLTPTPWSNPVTAVDHQGRLHIFWETLSQPRFIYHTYQTSEGWTAPDAIAQTLGTSQILFPPLVDLTGDLHLVWRNYLGLGIEKPYRLMYARFDGLHWTAEEELYRTGNSGVQAMVHHDQQGNIRVTLLDNTMTTTAHQLIRWSDGWHVLGIVQPGHLTQWVWPDMGGGIHFYGSNFSNQLYYSHWRDGQFQVHNYQSTGAVHNRNTQLDGQNNLHTFWKASVPVPGGTVTGLYHQCLQSDLSWRSQEVLSGYSAVTGEVPKAADIFSRVAISWKDSSPAPFNIGLWEGCNQLSQKVIPMSEPHNWDLKALALAQTPPKACVLFRRLFDSRQYTAVCADINRY